MSKVNHVIARVREAIYAGTLAPGAPVVQSDLATMLGVSTTPVREALRALESEGFVQRTASRGLVVADVSNDVIDDLYTIRASVEGLTTRIAAERLVMSQARELAALHAELTDEVQNGRPDRNRLRTLNRAFHFAIYDAGPSFASATISVLWSFLPNDVTPWNEPSIAEELLAEHTEILEALLEADGDRAERAMRVHLDTAATLRKGSARPRRRSSGVGATGSRGQAEDEDDGEAR